MDSFTREGLRNFSADVFKCILPRGVHTGGIKPIRHWLNELVDHIEVQQAKKMVGVYFKRMCIFGNESPSCVW